MLFENPDAASLTWAVMFSLLKIYLIYNLTHLK